MSKRRIGSPRHKRNTNLAAFSQKFFKKYSKASSDLTEKFYKFVNSWYLVVPIIFLELLMNDAIIFNVKYTEIDWSTYMTQVNQIFNGTNSEFDYSKVEGPTGPLVYPAGHVYIYKLLSSVTENGSNIIRAQYIFLVIYITQLIVTYLIYFHKRVSKVPPYVFLFISFTSYRIHSIYVLRLFNDPIAILFAYASFYALLNHKHSLSAFLFALALSVKMNVLLYAPAYCLIFYEDLGLLKSIKKSIIVFGVNLFMAAPFLYKNPWGYISRSFNFGRVFLHKWTVNWRFLDEDIFTSPRFFIALITLQNILILYVFRKRIASLFNSRRMFKPRDDPFLTLSICNFIGIVFCRSLHYQFYVWYYHSLPIILWATQYNVTKKLFIFGLIEYSWNQYPSTNISSILLQASHMLILGSLLRRKSDK